jgi:hypothetical protein
MPKKNDGEQHQRQEERDPALGAGSVGTGFFQGTPKFHQRRQGIVPAAMSGQCVDAFG